MLLSILYFFFQIFSYCDIYLESSIIDSLYDMIRDTDPNVVANAIYSLDEILAKEGGFATNKPLIMHLISKVNLLRLIIF